jgi:D-tyrosyl-tRNA(Tyr) deacylase
MRVVVQRVGEAAVAVAGEEIARIGRGYLVLAGFGKGDDESVLAWMAHKVATLRIFEDESGRMTLPLSAVEGRALVVSQFTLYGDCRKGARPSFDASAPPETARALYARFCALLEAELPGGVATGAFQERMAVSLVNEGPVTVVIEREAS